MIIIKHYDYFFIKNFDNKNIQKAYIDIDLLFISQIASQ